MTTRGCVCSNKSCKIFLNSPVVKAFFDPRVLERLIQAEDEFPAVLSNGELWATGLSRIERSYILPDVGDVATAAGDR